MDLTSREHLAQRLTEIAARAPRAYRLRVGALALLGYAFLFAVLGVVAALLGVVGWMVVTRTGLYVAVKLGIAVVVLAWMVLRSLWVRFHPPEGIALTRADAPALIGEIETVRRAMQAPPVHRVLLDDQFNASVTQYPRLGIFGFYRVYLTVGLPLMESMPREEFRAVLAHEFGHVSRAHGRFGAWVGRVESTWSRLLHELESQQHWARRPFILFFHWYAPYLAAHSAVLRRANEFEADRVAARVSGGALASALCRIEAGSRFLDRVFWPGVWEGAKDAPEPPSGVHHALAREVPAASARADAADWIAEAMAQPTRAYDSHPALRDRLAALGTSPAPPAPFTASAAEALLGPRAAELAEELSGRWRDCFAPAWKEEHDQARQEAGRLAELEARAEALSTAEADERVWLTARVRGVSLAIPLARTRLTAEQESASLHFFLGQALAERGDPGALAHLDRAAALEEEYILPALSAAAGLLERLGRAEEAEPYRIRIEEHYGVLSAAQAERSAETLSKKDRFVPHGLDPETLAAVVRELPTESVRAVYLVRKEVRHLPHHPCFVLAFLPRRTPAWFGGHMTPQQLVDYAVKQVKLPGDFICIVLSGDLKKYHRLLRRVDGAEVHRRGRAVAA